MADIQPGFTYGDPPNNILNAQNLNEHVANAVILPAFISAKAIKNPGALSDKFVIEDGGVLKYVTAQQLHDLILYPGSVVQTSYAEYTANTDLALVIPSDYTIPQSIEGTEILSASITPRFATSKIHISFQGQFSKDSTGDGNVAIFRNSIVDAIVAQCETTTVVNAREVWSVAYEDLPATTSPVTYKVRVGPSSGIIRLNGTTLGRMFAGASKATLILQEIKV